jgi:pilus assembly protein Flp/PilA
VDGHRVGTVEHDAQPQAKKKRGKAIMKLIQKFGRPVKNVEGATMIEYGLIVALVSVVAIGTLTTVGTNLSTLYGNIAALLP